MRKFFAIALIDQAILSIFNLGLNLVLIKLAAPAEFGRFIFASAVVLVLTSLQSALVATPLAVLIPGRDANKQESTAAVIVSSDVAFRLAATLAAPAICLMTDHSPDFLIMVAVVTFIALGRETARAMALAHERTVECLRIDATAIVCSMIAIAGFWWVLPPSVACLAGIATGNAVALLTQVSTKIKSFLPMGQALSNYRSLFWRDMQWSLIGAGTTELQYRSYVFALEIFRDAVVLASVQAGRLLLGPLPLVVGAWGRVARPAMARHLASGNSSGMIKLTIQGMIYVTGVAAIYCLALYALWPMLSSRVFQGKYPDVGLMTVAWSGYMITVICHMVLSVPLQAAMRLKELAQVTMVTAILSCILLIGLWTNVSAIYAVLALTAAEIVALAWILILVARLARGHSSMSTSMAAPQQ